MKNNIEYSILNTSTSELVSWIQLASNNTILVNTPILDEDTAYTFTIKTNVTSGTEFIVITNQLNITVRAYVEPACEIEN